jgi:hypothetical protein
MEQRREEDREPKRTKNSENKSNEEGSVHGNQSKNNEAVLHMAPIKFGSFSAPAKKQSWAEMAEEDEGMLHLSVPASSYVSNSIALDNRTVLAPLFDQVAAHTSEENSFNHLPNFDAACKNITSTVSNISTSPSSTKCTTPRTPGGGSGGVSLIHASGARCMSPKTPSMGSVTCGFRPSPVASPNRVAQSTATSNPVPGGGAGSMPRGHDSAPKVTGGEVQRKGASAAASLTLGESSGCTMLPTGTLPSHCGRPGGPNCMVGSKTAAAMVTPSRDQVISFGGINESAAVRSSARGRLRAQPNADATQLERAMMIAQRRDDIQMPGTRAPNALSILAFSDDQIVQKASTLGVSLGCSQKNRMAAASLIKETEVQRSLTILKKNDAVVDKGLFDSSNMLVSRASNLCEDLVDDENFMSDAQIEHLVQDKKAVVFYRKKSYDKANVRRSKRIKLKRNCA